MPIYVPKPKTFTPCPKGQYSAVCVDVVDLGMQDTGFVDEKTGQQKWSPKIDIVWQVDKMMENGKPFLVNQRYTLSFADYPKMSNLRLLLDAWNIAIDDLADPATGEWDIEGLIGMHCLINVVHRESRTKPGNFFANVGSLMPLPAGMTPLQGRDYVRRHDRPKDESAEEAQHVDQRSGDDDIPF
jgi:hypothetical protein